MSSRDVAPKKVLEMMREATGASEEDICVMLQLCNGDANEATEKLLENPFARVESKKDKRLKAEEQRRMEAERQRRSGVDSRRPAPAVRARGRGEFGRGRGIGRGLARSAAGGYASAPASNGTVWEDPSAAAATPPSEVWPATTATGLAEQQAAPSKTDDGWGSAPASTDGWNAAAAPAASSATTKEGVSFASLLRSKTEAVADSGEASPVMRQPVHEAANPPAGEVSAAGNSLSSSWPDSAPAGLEEASSSVPASQAAQPAVMGGPGLLELAPTPAPSSSQPALYGQADAAAGAAHASPLYGPVAAVAAGEVEGLQLTFGNFTLNSPGMGEFGAGFGNGFGSSDAAPKSSASTGDMFGGGNGAAAATPSVPAAAGAATSSASDGSTGYGYGGVVAADQPSHVGAASRAGAYGGLQAYGGLEGFDAAPSSAPPPSTSYGDAFAYSQESLRSAGYAGNTVSVAGTAAGSSASSYQPGAYAAYGSPAAGYTPDATRSASAAIAAPGNMGYGVQHAAYSVPYAQYPSQVYNMAYANPYGYNPYAANPYAAPPGQGSFTPQGTRYPYGSSAQAPTAGYDDSSAQANYSTYGNYAPTPQEKDSSGNLYSAYGQQQKQQQYQYYR